MFDKMMMPSLEKISYYVKFLDKVQDNLEKGGCYMQNVIDAKISIQNKKMYYFASINSWN